MTLESYLVPHHSKYRLDDEIKLSKPLDSSSHSKILTLLQTVFKIDQIGSFLLTTLASFPKSQTTKGNPGLKTTLFSMVDLLTQMSSKLRAHQHTDRYQLIANKFEVDSEDLEAFTKLSAELYQLCLTSVAAPKVVNVSKSKPKQSGKTNKVKDTTTEPVFNLPTAIQKILQAVKELFGSSDGNEESKQIDELLFTPIDRIWNAFFTVNSKPTKASPFLTEINQNKQDFATNIRANLRPHVAKPAPAGGKSSKPKKGEPS